jgi:16S rRNA (uracil1498-N3)-methyltransferase
MPRFFAYKGQLENDSFTIEGTDANHIASVLRGKVGDEIVICDGEGTDYYCTLTQVDKKSVTARVNQSCATASEPRVKITLYQGLPKSDKMELIIQKCVEIGLVRIVPVKTEFAVAKLDGKEDKKRERWQKIAEAAAKQCGRGIIPTIDRAMSFAEAVADSKQCSAAIIPYENETQYGIKQFARGFQGDSIAVFIGPEGGFAPKEIELALKNGITSVTLGKRILRTETAGLVTGAVLLYELEG